MFYKDSSFVWILVLLFFSFIFSSNHCWHLIVKVTYWLWFIFLLFLSFSYVWSSFFFKVIFFFFGTMFWNISWILFECKLMVPSFCCTMKLCYLLFKLFYLDIFISRSYFGMILFLKILIFKNHFQWLYKRLCHDHIFLLIFSSKGSSLSYWTHWL